MFTFLIMLFTLMGMQERFVEEGHKAPSLVVHLNKKETLELVELLEGCENQKLITDLIADHVKSIYYDDETKSSTIVFKNSK